jgi:hypothetical protein
MPCNVLFTGPFDDLLNTEILGFGVLPMKQCGGNPDFVRYFQCGCQRIHNSKLLMNS